MINSGDELSSLGQMTRTGLLPVEAWSGLALARDEVH
jgi:hypothetical protein